MVEMDYMDSGAGANKCKSLLAKNLWMACSRYCNVVTRGMHGCLTSEAKFKPKIEVKDLQRSAGYCSLHNSMQS